MRNDIIHNISMLSELEHNKLDRFFLCGSLSGTPNEELMYACDAFLEAEKKGIKDQQALDRMITELEKADAANKKSESAVVGLKVVDEASELISEILLNKDIL